MKMARRRRPTMRTMKQAWLSPGNLRMNVHLEINHAPAPQIAPSQPNFESRTESYHFFLLLCKGLLHSPGISVIPASPEAFGEDGRSYYTQNGGKISLNALLRHYQK
jgi:hypothetical protein